MFMKLGISALIAAATVAAVGIAAQTAPKKILIAHRGASAYAPEHTIHAYTLAMEQGADFVEQDLAVSKDGVLVCIHDLTLERTTDVEEVFPDRFIEVKEGPKAGKHWMVNDFTLAELKRLDAGSWFDKKFAGSRLLTFQEAIDLVRTKPGTGLYPELKDPEFYRDKGIDQVKLFLDAVAANRLADDPKTPFIVQSFDADTLRRLAVELPKVRRLFLVDPQLDMWRAASAPEGTSYTFTRVPSTSRVDSAEKVKAISTWATGLGPSKTIVDTLPDLVAWTHDAGMTLTLYTFRASSPGRFASVGEEMKHYLDLGVDELFTDNPDQFPRN